VRGKNLRGRGWEFRRERFLGQKYRMPFISPPAPPRDGVFVLSTPQHMLAKLGWEVGQFKRTVHEQQGQLGAILFAGYQAFNCAVTAWHCADWAWVYADGDLKVIVAERFSLKIKSDDRKNREAFFDAVCSENRDIEICRHIANSSKHLKLDKVADRGFHANVRYVAPAEQREGEYDLIFGMMITDEKRGGSIMLEHVFDRAFVYWRMVYAELGYIEGTYVDSSGG
jgi:hypothetical protein